MPADANRSSPPDASRLLAIYVRDHLAGATGGMALARRSRRNNEGTSYAGMLAAFEQENSEDRAALQSIMTRLEIGPSRVKMALAVVAEFVARVKSNGRLVRYSPSSRVVELEGLAAAVTTKRNLWRALRRAGTEPAVPTGELDRLVERASDQLERLLAAHDQATAEAFGAAPS